MCRHLTSCARMLLVFLPIVASCSVDLGKLRAPMVRDASDSPDFWEFTVWGN